MSVRRSRALLVAGLFASTVAAGVLTAPSANAVVGVATKDGSYPFTARLDIGGTRSCSAALVDEQWLLTAASCFADNPAQSLEVPAGAPKVKTTATVGRTDMSRESGGTVATVEKLVPRGDRDLVMAKLDKPVTGIAPAEVTSKAPLPGEDVFVSGYGRTKDEWVPDRLHYGRFSVGAAKETTVGITGKDNGAAVCEGDTGAPVWRDIAGRYELVGVSSQSWQGGCFGHDDEKRTDAVASRTDDVAGWIQTVRLSTKFQNVSDVLTSADFNGDGRTDVAAVMNDGNLHAFYAKPDGTLQYGRELWTHDGTWGGYQQLIGGDFNGDGQGDIIARRDDGQMFLYTGTANGNLNPRVAAWYDKSWQTMKQIVRYRADNSGRDGLAAIWGDGSLHAYTAKADGTLSGTKRDLWHDKSWGGMRILSSGDFNADGKDDIVATDPDGGFRLYTGNAQGTVTRAPDLWHDKSWSSMRALLGGDFNGDGKADIAALWGDRSLHLYTGNGKGALAAGPAMWPTAF
ncbi:FG-GAP-like repeat-containing protein [Streptomyces rimosus]|uniref:Trypsin-like serine protease n=2 Tax=Streptomyces rimosus subsp. rimosus TaxID=132474 RepID=A0A8A1UZH0_STRR1|nr:FG-GAP-like repeat-containing protein [Streptomyces rimosus]KOG71156.1 esterase [Kitasatospora aureofaciens]KOT33906.1 esterase [Streptomyces sp. NRRL WC-3701]MYT47912.1 trypsin-like serine protease [Streptomyces sp. SID5471]QGY69137.1 trypsin-like serine protease [Streptomyces rimosus R6-500]KOT57336.1 esterase [Streptomyces rimosus subsp. rimosus]